jgi:hypothetical protein
MEPQRNTIYPSIPSVPFLPDTNPEILGDNGMQPPYQSYNQVPYTPQQNFVPQQPYLSTNPQVTQPYVVYTPPVPQNVILRVDTSIVPTNMAITICSEARKDLVLNVPEGKNRGEVIIIWSKEKNATNQEFVFTTDGFIQCVNNPHLVWDCQQALPGTPIMLSIKKDENDPQLLTQKWNVEKSGLGTSNLIVCALNPNLVLELPGSQQKGLPVCLAPRNVHASYQCWNFDVKKLKLFVAIDTDTYISYVPNGLYMDVPQSKVGEARLVILYGGKMLFNTNQRWRITKEGFICSALDENYVLSCTVGAIGERVMLSKKRGTQNLNQRWMIVMADKGPHKYIISMANPSVVIDSKDNVLVLAPNRYEKNVSQTWDLTTA